MLIQIWTLKTDQQTTRLTSTDPDPCLKPLSAPTVLLEVGDALGHHQRDRRLLVLLPDAADTSFPLETSDPTQILQSREFESQMKVSGFDSPNPGILAQDN